GRAVDRAGRQIRDVDRDRIGDQALERDLVERRAVEDLMGRRVDVCADVVDQVVLAHRVAVVGDARDRTELGLRDARIDGHLVEEMVVEVDDAFHGPPPTSMRLRTAGSMLPPETMQTPLRAPATRDDSAVATDSAPAPSAITRVRSAIVRTAAATSSSGRANAPSRSCEACSQTSGISSRLPEPSTNEGG